METNTTNKPEFYKNQFYPKELVVEITEKSLPRARRGKPFAQVGDKIALSIEIKDFFDDPDCKVSSFAHNFWIRTPKGLESKAYASEKKLEYSVRLMMAAYGFKFVGWQSAS